MSESLQLSLFLGMIAVGLMITIAFESLLVSGAVAFLLVTGGALIVHLAYPAEGPRTRQQ
ncbi:hypothetical protein [Exiguobacterium flavidum]|uniref:hypothetical protein n=1 Tax=Exiguobacterium flavidum TaxID=2184695 RepID=UPI000DF7E53D|nr:hypothetical protein [Exiguobacterium flavidum]